MSVFAAWIYDEVRRVRSESAAARACNHRDQDQGGEGNKRNHRGRARQGVREPRARQKPHEIDSQNSGRRQAMARQTLGDPLVCVAAVSLMHALAAR